MNAWVLDKHKPLGEVLCEQGALLPEGHEAIETLVQRHLLRNDNNSERSPCCAQRSTRLQDRVTVPPWQFEAELSAIQFSTLYCTMVSVKRDLSPLPSIVVIRSRSMIVTTLTPR
jgi:hypothetical protein